MATNSSSSAGAAGCPCVDETATLASLVERACQTPDGSEGVLLTAEGPCVLPSYGSQYCLQHDLIHDPDCSLGGGNNIIPAYCTKPWCYVDAETCTRASDERIYRSTYFPREDGVDVVSLCVCCNNLLQFTFFASEHISHARCTVSPAYPRWLSSTGPTPRAIQPTMIGRGFSRRKRWGA